MELCAGKKKNESICSRTEYMCFNERVAGGTLRFKEVEVGKIHEVNYLGLTVQSNRDCGMG